MRPSSSLALLLLTLVVRRDAAGQQQPASIPTELAVALLDHGESASGNRVPKLVVGRVPASIPASLTNLEGAVIIGGLEYPQSAIAVLGFTRPPNQVALAFENALATRGWKPPPPPPSRPEQEGSGFVSNSYFYGSSWGANVYCSDSGVVNTSYTPAPSAGTYLKVQFSRDVERSICSPRRYATAYGLKLLKFPPLHPPPGMTQRGGGGGSGGDDASTSARVNGPLDVTNIVAFYLRELDSAGWKTGKIVATDDLAAASLSVTDPDGTEWKGAFTASRIAAFEVALTIRMSRLGDR